MGQPMQMRLPRIAKPLLLGTLLLLSGCQSKPKETYVDFQGWSQERPCTEVRFMCLPESRDTHRWHTPLTNGLDRFELTPQVMHRYHRIVTTWNQTYEAYHSRPHPKGEKEPMLITVLDKDFFDRVEQKQFIDAMEQDLAKEFPGFWRDVPKKVRDRWIQRAMNKAKKFGITSKKPGGIVELCARIGLDFDKDPKWDYITKFIEEDPKNHVVYAIDYIDWTIFNKEYNRAGTKITDWSMRRAIGKLPDPQKPYPRLNDD